MQVSWNFLSAKPSVSEVLLTIETTRPYFLTVAKSFGPSRSMALSPSFLETWHNSSSDHLPKHHWLTDWLIRPFVQTVSTLSRSMAPAAVPVSRVAIAPAASRDVLRIRLLRVNRLLSIRFLLCSIRITPTWRGRPALASRGHLGLARQATIHSSRPKNKGKMPSPRWGPHPQTLNRSFSRLISSTTFRGASPIGTFSL